MSVSTAESSFAVGSLVSVRGREWVVLPESDTDFLVLRPIGGTDDDIAGVIPSLEDVQAASFGLPSATDLGDDRSARLLRDALRIGFRSSGGPFRSLAGLNVSPRPYQLVPLLLALRQDVVRLLIADDVGIGKTVEAGLVAAELLAQGEASGLTVLCPPSLAEQWRQELSQKFGIEAELVLPGTAKKLQRAAGYDQSIFEHFKHTIVSTDFIKSESKRHDFLRTAPDLVIVDEAHGVTADDSGKGGSGRTQRYELVRGLADDPNRHLILVTATPHSGNDAAFRNLIGLLDSSLKTTDLSGEAGRRKLADHMVQRRRVDIRNYLKSDTKFPKDRETVEVPYKLSPEHRAFFDAVLNYVRGRVQDKTGTKLEQRIRWWSALSLLRSMASSPAAAAATLNTRAVADESESDASAEKRGMTVVMDQVEDDGGEAIDVVPGSRPEGLEEGSGEKRQLNGFLRTARELSTNPASDAKLQLLLGRVRQLVSEGYQPIVFCRFIPTAHYVADFLRESLKKKFDVEVVTGELPAEERAARIANQAERAGELPKILVATDCLSEGVNLQDGFQAVIHYDLAWNPTRHEQREGRVDRFGQLADKVRALTIYGDDNGIDGIVLDVLLRKHESIRRDLGISVPVPPKSDQVLSALLEGILMRGQNGDQLELFSLTPEAEQLDADWRSSAQEESASRSRFAQNAIHPEQVQSVVEAARRSLGDPGDVAAFIRAALEETGAHVEDTSKGLKAELMAAVPGIRNALGAMAETTFVRDFPAPRNTSVLVRTDPAVANVAQYVLNSALDEQLGGKERPARRCGFIKTHDVDQLTTALLVRFRTKLILPARLGDRTDMAEEARVLAFTGTPKDPSWLSDAEVEQLMLSKASANAGDVSNMMSKILSSMPLLTDWLNAKAQAVAEEIRDAHREVRIVARGDRAGQLGIRGLTVEANLPVDILGVYVYSPAGGNK
ncbi:superfamily II DNA or RNA helicase [Arthrobacter sp. 1088]|uniref:helicase-related protein n=1 Tax=Arthrobacter sp. 1088 TaxID=2817768 RepID=UPI0028548590|nr:helicase-related protein [Arthrobacter sp. 1088]MDR6685761.1 superfamily II DNA or RNA helicase [Arthrobacter sp. 1088]